MSTTTIRKNFDIDGIPTNMTSCVLRDSAALYGVKRQDTGAVVVAAGTAMVNTAVGEYEYTFTDPASNLQYDWTIEFVYGGETYWIDGEEVGGIGGGGPGTVIAKAIPEACVSLARYAEICELNENAFWGINDGTDGGACQHIWTQKERNRIARYLAEAQEEIEQVTNYPLCPRWFADEQHPYGFPVHSKWGKVIEAGREASATIALATAPSYVTDPAVIGPIATTVTDEDEVHVYYPGSTREITTDEVTIAGGNVTIKIPWCRLVDPASFDNPATGLAYADPTIYTPSVDVLRVYNDHSTEGGLVWPHRTTSDCTCTCNACCGTCGEYAINACIYIRNTETGAMDLLPATYANAVWTAACSTCYCESPSYVRLNYKAGLNPITYQAEDAVIRLAHAKMPLPPCGCGLIQELWTRDRNTPEVLTAERLNCSFGLSDGSWVAWRFAHAMRLQRGLALG